MFVKMLKRKGTPLRGGSLISSQLPPFIVEHTLCYPKYPLTPKMPVCAVCSSPAPHKCARCKCVFYCTPAHQKEDWPLHKILCPRLAQEALAAVFHPCDEELLLRITTCFAQNGYHKEVGVMVQLNKAFWWDEQIWDAFKDVPGAGGRTRLMYASGREMLIRVKWLLARGAKVNVVIPLVGHTALMCASYTGRLEVVRELIERGACVNAARTTDGMTALMWACQKGHLEEVRELRGASVNAARTTDGYTSLMSACKNGHLEAVCELINRGASVNASTTNDGSTALILASQYGHLEVVRGLIKEGANLDAVLTNFGGSAVMWASWKGHTEVVRELCSHHCWLNLSTTGINPAANTTLGMTPLMIAAREGHKDTVSVLLSFGADPLAVDDQGWTAHAFAAEKGHVNVCALLV